MLPRRRGFAARCIRQEEKHQEKAQQTELSKRQKARLHIEDIFNYSAENQLPSTTTKNKDFTTVSYAASEA
jgi:hypothetical protein